MAANKILNIEPIALGASVANLLNPGITSLAGPVGYTQTQPYLLIKHVRVFNNSGASLTINLYKGATGASAAGTESFWPLGTSVPANSYLDWYGQLRVDAADFITGNASAGSNAASVQFDGEIGIA